MTQSLESKEANPEKTTSRRSSISKKKVWFFGAVGVFLLLLVTLAGYSFAYVDRLPPRTRIAGVAIGGLTQDEAKARLSEAARQFKETEQQITFQDKKWSIKPADLQSVVEVDAALEIRWNEDKKSPWYKQVGQLLSSLVVSRDFDVDFTAYTPEGKEYLQKTILDSVETPYQETTLAVSGVDVSVVAGKAGTRLDGNSFESSLYSVFKKRADSVTLQLMPFEPEVTAEQAVPTQERFRDLLAAPWTFTYGNAQTKSIAPTQIAPLLATEVAHSASGEATGLKVMIKKDSLRALLEEWNKEVHVAPSNAWLKMENGILVVAQEGKVGADINIDQSISSLSTQLQAGVPVSSRALAVVIDTVQPEVRQETLATLGLKELIGTNTTDFTGSPNNRKFNIAKGQSALNRLLIKNGETFSTTTAIGPVEESTGYLPELVIKGNRTVPEAGGGLCQVSTTLFRSVLSAGLPIVERQNHAYRVGYYEREVGPGLDATIYIPKPDFRWKNDTGNAVYMQSYVKDNKITFELYGTKDGRSVTISKPEILETYTVGQPIYSETDTLAKGETKQIETAHDGAKTSVTYTVMKEGKELNKQTFISTYRAWPAQYLVGTRE